MTHDNNNFPNATQLSDNVSNFTVIAFDVALHVLPFDALSYFHREFRLGSHD